MIDLGAAPDALDDEPAVVQRCVEPTTLGDHASQHPDTAPGAHPSRRLRLPRPTRNGWITTAIAVATAVLYAWNLAAVGNANNFYAAAIRSGGVSWKAWFFGSLDPGSFITVDKPPVAMWLPGLSARLFGFSPWSMLLPNVLAGVASVLILHHLVRRWKGDTAAHLAAAGFAVTPVATVIFRSNNPDAMLTLLALAATWALWNALESGSTRPLLISAALTGLAFNTKMLQAFLVLPAMTLVYLVAGPPKLGRRLWQLAMALGVLVVSAGWYTLVVVVVPAASRPYIGSTSDNSIVSLMLGYNGFDRVFGGTSANRIGSAVGFGGTPGLWRMLSGEVGGQVGWLFPMAGLGLLAGLWLWLRDPLRRRGLELAGWLLWGCWAVTCVAVFSFSKGIFHPYYTVQLAPAVAALAGAGAIALWQLGRNHASLRLILPVAIAVTAGLAVGMLRRSPSYASGLRTAIVIGGAVACAGLVAGTIARHRRLVIVAAGAAAVTLLAAPLAYSMTTVANPGSGSMVIAGPAVRGLGLGGLIFGQHLTVPARRGDTGQQTLVSYLEAHRGNAEFIVAAVGASTTEPIIIASGLPVLTIGGFNGSDPAPTLAEFQGLVAAGRVRYLLTGAYGVRGGRASSGSILGWATEHGTLLRVGGMALYDLGSPVA
ncbi:MAG: glycosyltransferase family 39 protein [Ilumatobacteraceae bacterium]